MNITLAVDTSKDLETCLSGLTEAQLGYFLAIDPDKELDEEESTNLLTVVREIYRSELDLGVIPDLSTKMLEDFVGKFLVECTVEALIREGIVAIDNGAPRLLYKESATYTTKQEGTEIIFTTDFGEDE